MAWLHHPSGFNHTEVKRFFFCVSIDWKADWGEACGELKFLGGEIVLQFLHSNYDCIKLYGSKLCYMFLYSIVFYYAYSLGVEIKLSDLYSYIWCNSDIQETCDGEWLKKMELTLWRIQFCDYIVLM